MDGVHVTVELVPQQLDRESRGAAVEFRAVNEQTGRLVNRAQVSVAMDDDKRMPWHVAIHLHSPAPMGLDHVLATIAVGLWGAVLGPPALIVAFFAILHGQADGRELPEGTSALLYSLGFVVATGSWIAAAGLLRSAGSPDRDGRCRRVRNGPHTKRTTTSHAAATAVVTGGRRGARKSAANRKKL